MYSDEIIRRIQLGVHDTCFLVAPLLILIPLAYLYRKQLKLSDTMITSLMYLLIGFGITVFLYHGNKLRKNL